MTQFNVWLAVSAYPIGVTLLHLFNRSANLTIETERKLMHMLIGIFLLPIPWLVQSDWLAVILFSTVAFGPLIVPYFGWARRWFGRMLSVKRKNMGGSGAAFGLGLLSLFLLSTPNYKLYYLICASVVIFADAAAAIVGTRYPKLRFKFWSSAKTLSGSTAFVIVAFICIALPLLLFTHISILKVIEVGLLTALIAAVIEAISSLGLDNFLIPLACYAVLRLML